MLEVSCSVPSAVHQHADTVNATAWVSPWAAPIKARQERIHRKAMARSCLHSGVVEDLYPPAQEPDWVEEGASYQRSLGGWTDGADAVWFSTWRSRNMKVRHVKLSRGTNHKQLRSMYLSVPSRCLWDKREGNILMMSWIPEKLILQYSVLNEEQKLSFNIKDSLHFMVKNAQKPLQKF